MKLIHHHVTQHTLHLQRSRWYILAILAILAFGVLSVCLLAFLPLRGAGASQQHPGISKRSHQYALGSLPVKFFWAFCLRWLRWTDSETGSFRLRKASKTTRISSRLSSTKRQLVSVWCAAISTHQWWTRNTSPLLGEQENPWPTLTGTK